MLDLTEVRYVDSSGVRVIFELAAQLGISGRRLALAVPETSPRPPVGRKITRLEEAVLLCTSSPRVLRDAAPGVKPASPGPEQGLTLTLPGVGERRTAMAAVLVADLVGSAELMATIGQDEFRDFLRDHFARLGEVVDQHEGTRIKTLGDGMLATFPSATDTVASTVALQQAVERRGRPGGEPVAMRVGLALGEVGMEDGDVLGTPVVVAARLAAAAGGSQILASDVVHVVYDDPGRALFVEVGDLILKGLPDPVTTFEVVWKPLPVSAVPLPPLLTDIGPIFVGRDADLDRFQAVWDDAGSGELRLLLLAGEPGVGKTRLAAEMASWAHQAGSTVLAGRCDEDLPVPQQPFVEALRHFVDHSPDAGLAESLGRYGGELTRLLPELATRVPVLPPPIRSDPETEQYRLFDAVAAWLGQASAERQLLLLLDDLQWAAKASLLLLRHLLRTPGLGRVVVVGTYRDTELTHDHPLVGLLADLRRHPGVRRVSLDGLVEADVMAFVEQYAGHALVDRERGPGPGHPRRDPGEPVLPAGGPPPPGGDGGGHRRRRPVERRPRHRGRGHPRGRAGGRRPPPGPAVGAGQHRPAVGRGSRHRLRAGRAEAPGDLDEDDVLSALEEAMEARVLIEPSGATSRYRFSHALIRETVYGELSTARRVVLHRRIGEAIESLYGGRLDEHLPALAHHYGQASVPAASEKALGYAIGAGDRAVAQMANDQAASYYQRALELLEVVEPAGDDPRRLDLLLRLGDAQPWRRPRPPGDAAGRRPAGGRAGRAKPWPGRPWPTTGGCGRRWGRSTTSGWPCSRPRSTPRSRSTARCGPGSGQPGGGGRLRQGGQPGPGAERQALAMSRRLGDRATLAEVLLSRVVAIWAPTTVDERLAHTRELLDVAGTLGDSVLVCAGSWHRFVAAMEAGDVAEADTCLDAAELLAAEMGQPTARWFTMILRANRLLVAGEVDRSEALSYQALELGLAAGHSDAALFHSVHVFNVFFERGTLGIADAVAQLTAANPGVRSLQATLALLHADLGQVERAPPPTSPSSASSELRQEPYWLRTVTQAAYACHQLGDRSGAGVLLDLLAPFADQLVCTGLSWGGSVWYYAGLLASTLGHLDRADASLARGDGPRRHPRSRLAGPNPPGPGSRPYRTGLDHRHRTGPDPARAGPGDLPPTGPDHPRSIGPPPPSPPSPPPEARRRTPDWTSAVHAHFQDPGRHAPRGFVLLGHRRLEAGRSRPGTSGRRPGRRRRRPGSRSPAGGRPASR